jgi:hypothetical protein
MPNSAGILRRRATNLWKIDKPASFCCCPAPQTCHGKNEAVSGKKMANTLITVIEIGLEGIEYDQHSVSTGYTA